VNWGFGVDDFAVTHDAQIYGVHPAAQITLREAGADRGIVGVESLSLQGLAFFDIHTVFDARPSLTVPRGLAPPSHGLATRLCGSGAVHLDRIAHHLIT
jgi:hypothetical protein